MKQNVTKSYTSDINIKSAQYYHRLSKDNIKERQGQLSLPSVSCTSTINRLMITEERETQSSDS